MFVCAWVIYVKKHKGTRIYCTYYYHYCIVIIISNAIIGRCSRLNIHISLARIICNELGIVMLIMVIMMTIIIFSRWCEARRRRTTRRTPPSHWSALETAGSSSEWVQVDVRYAGHWPLFSLYGPYVYFFLLGAKKINRLNNRQRCKLCWRQYFDSLIVIIEHKSWILSAIKRWTGFKIVFISYKSGQIKLFPIELSGKKKEIYKRDYFKSWRGVTYFDYINPLEINKFLLVSNTELCCWWWCWWRRW